VLKMPLSKAVREQRRKGLGGSDAGAVYGKSDYGTPLTVYWSKIAPLAPEKESDLFWFGHEGEKFVAARIWHDLRRAKQYRGRKLIEPKAMMWHPNGWAFGNADRVLVDKKTGKWLAGYECKWITHKAHQWSKEGENVRFPAAYYAQCFHYLWVARANGHQLEEWWLVAAIYGRDVRYYRVPWDEDFAKKYEAKLERFWRLNVLGKIPPPPTASKRDTAILNERFKVETDQALIANATTENKLQRYRKADAEIKRLTAERDQIKNDLRNMLGPSVEITGNNWRATYRAPAKPRRVVDYKALTSELGATEKQIARHTKPAATSRTLRINLGEENG